MAELAESMQIEKMHDVLPFTSAATIQRLGYLFEHVLEENEMADMLFELLTGNKKNLQPVMMRNDAQRRDDCLQNR